MKNNPNSTTAGPAHDSNPHSPLKSAGELALARIPSEIVDGLQAQHGLFNLEELKQLSPDARAEIATELFNRGVFPTRNDAQMFVTWYVARALGEPLAPEILRYLDENETVIKAMNSLSHARSAAVAAQRARDALTREIATAEEQLRDEEFSLVQLKQERDFYAEGHAPGQKPPTSTLIEFYSKGIACHEAIRVLEGKVIPRCKDRLSSARSALEKHDRARVVAATQ